MGQRPSTPKRESFSGVLPSLSSKSAKHVREAPNAAVERASSRPVEAPIPAIETPPHALQQHTPVSPRRAHDDAFAVPESVRKSRTLEQFADTCSEILPAFLYVSNVDVANDHDHLVRVGVTHVVNCCKEVACFPETPHDTITYKQLAVRDGVQEDLMPFFCDVIEFIELARRQNGRVLIHCHQGVSRSCAFAIAYVMFRDRSGFHAANAFVKAKRAVCSPNAAFICQLLEWEQALGGGTDYGLYRLAPHAAHDPSTLVLKSCYYKDSRRKVVMAEDKHTWLWHRGLFVLMDERGIVMWKGSQCTIPNAVDAAKGHVQRMLRVLGHGGQEAEITMVHGDDGDSGTDHFEYASELAWISPLPVAVVSSQSPSPPQEAIEDKPTLFLLQDTNAWEHLTNFDTDDLLSSSVLLLVAVPHSYLWLGRDHVNDNAETLRATAQSQTATSIHVEHQDHESSSFWDAFEAGY